MRFLGLYDAVDMAKDYPKRWSQEEADKLHGGVFTYGIVIAKGPINSRWYFRRPFPTGRASDRFFPRGTMTRLHGTHSAIGGAPDGGIFESLKDLEITMDDDRNVAIQSDQFIRRRAVHAKIEIKEKSKEDYDYPFDK